MKDKTKRALKIGGAIVVGITAVSGLALVGLLGLAGAGGYWYYTQDEPTDEVATTVPETTPTEEVVAEEEGEETAEVEETADFFRPGWYDPRTYYGDEESATDDATASTEPEIGTDSTGTETTASTEPEIGTDSTGTDSTGTEATASTEPSAATPAPIIVKGVKPYGVSTWVPSKSGHDKPTFTVVLGDVPGSARSEAGETESFWVQGVHTDPDDGSLRADVGNKVVSPDDIREDVGIKTAWTALRGYTNVYVACKAIQADDGEHPGGCRRSSASSAQSVASR